MTHKRVGVVNAHTEEGSLDLDEYECGNRYTLVQAGADFCPLCGEEL